MIGSQILRTGNRVVAPVMIAMSLYLLLRGHGAVGGGFIGGLTAGSAVVLLYLSHGHIRVWENRLLRIAPLVGGGLLIAVGYGAGGLLLEGSFLAGGKAKVPIVGEVAVSLVFDIGVYLVVVGMLVAIMRHLGREIPEEPPVPSERTVS